MRAARRRTRLFARVFCRTKTSGRPKSVGFIGSHLCERLLDLGHEVVGLDAFIPYYPRAAKERNLASLTEQPGFRFHALDLRRDPLDAVVRDAEIVFHLAAMPGLTKSWTDFEGYNSCNVLATPRLLDALRTAPRLRRLIHGSTSSVYGRFATGDETLPTHPVSPYGVTKLATTGDDASACRLDGLNNERNRHSRTNSDSY